MMCPARPVAVIVKTPIKGWAILPLRGFVIRIPKMGDVFHCLKFYFQMSVFLIVRTVFLDALMMSNEPLLLYKKWWI